MRTIIRFILIAAVALATLVPGRAIGRAPTGPRGDVIPGRYIVVFKPGIGQAAARSVKAQAIGLYNADVIHEYSAALDGFAARMSPAAATALQGDPSVALVEPDRVVTYRAERLATDDTQTGTPWGLDRIDQRDLPLDARYTYSETGNGVNIYVLDSGIRLSHIEFAGRAFSGFTAIDDGLGTDDCDGHGTHVAGTIGGTTYGVAKQARLYAVRVLACDGYGSIAGVIAGVDWVTANHVKPAVANMSLGGGPSAALDAAVRNSTAAGVTYVLAAGNDYAQNACNYSPARVTEGITVGASEHNDYRAGYSNIGGCLDLFAPGSAIVSAWFTSDTATASMSGTSMAAPHVAGAAAKYLQTYPDASPATVQQALVSTATPNKIRNAGAGSPNRLLFTPGTGNAPDNDGGPIGIGESRNGTIAPAYDTDDFTFDGLAGQVVLITQNKASGSALDSFVELYRPDGRLLGSNDDGGGNKNARLQATLPVNGQYRIRAKAYRASTGAYVLSLSLVTAGDPDDFRWIAFGQTLTGTISPASDRDSYYVSVAAGRTLRLRMNKLTSTLDPYLELYNPNGVRVSYNDDGGGDRNALLSYVVPAAGVYRIVARSYALRSSGQYQLSLEGVPLTNLAQDRPAVASSTEFIGVEPWQATDGDLGTRWAAKDGDGQWWYVDLGSPQSFDQVVIHWESGYARRYGVFVADDAGAPWQNVFWTNEGDGGVDVVTFEQRIARYVMVYGAQRGTALPLSFYAVSVFDTGQNSTPTALAAEEDAKPSDETPPEAPEPPAEDGKDPQLPGDGADGQESTPAAESAAALSLPAPLAIEPPIAVILQADTNAVEENRADVLHLIGAAAANAARGRSIVAYEWRSHRDGTLSTEITATLPISQLAPGPHMITFRAQDDQGHWSYPDSVLWINPPAAFVHVPLVRRSEP